MSTSRDVLKGDLGLEHLVDICEQIEQSLDLSIDRTNPDEVMGKIDQLVGVLQTSAHAVALAEMLYNRKIAQLVETPAYSKLSATDKKMIFAGRAQKELYYVDLTERQNKAVVHAIEALRSIISYIKEEMRNIQS